MSERFHDCHWGQCLELLSHLCEYSDNILLVTGPDGIGKTTMKQELIDQKSAASLVCAIDATANMTAEQLTVYIEQDFVAATDKDCLLIIDDAQNLNLDVIAIIFQLKQRSENTQLQIVLFATQDFEHKVVHSVLKDDFAEYVQNIDIEPLTISEVESFLRQQWRYHRHTTDEMPLNKAQCKKIYAQSGGLPGMVQEIAAQMLEGRAIKGNSEHSLSPFAVGVTVSFGIIFCILAILWPTADKELLTTSTIEQPLPIAAKSTADEVLIETAEFTTLAKIEPEPTVEKIEPQATVETVAVVQPVEPVVAETPVAPPVDVEQKIAYLEQKVNDLQKQMHSDQKALRAAEQKLQKLLGSGTKGVPAKKLANPAVKKILTLTKHEKKILSLPGANYTLQLLCMNKEDQVKDFMRTNKLDNTAYYYKSHFKGKDWYILVYGNYANRLDAQLAVANLPLNLKKLHPWVREYVNVQQSITNRGKNE